MSTPSKVYRDRDHQSEVKIVNLPRPTSSGEPVRSGDLAAVATSGVYGDLSNRPAFVLVEKDLGSLPRTSGVFDITGLVGLTPNNPVLIQQAGGTYTGKGTLTDEAEMDSLIVSAFVLDAATIRACWNSSTFVVGNFKFCYLTL